LSGDRFFAGRQVLILSSVDWSAAWQRHHALAEAFADAGAEVFFVENTGFRGLRWSDAGRVLGRLARLSPRAAEPGPGHGRIHIVSPLVLPPSAAAFRWFNAACLLPVLAARLRRLGLRPEALALAYLPTATTLALLDALKPGRVVYDCVDNFFGHPSAPGDLQDTEAALLRRAGLVMATSPLLFEAARAKHPNVLLVHHGVSDDFFLPAGPPPRSYRRCCYFGTIRGGELDFEAIAALAEAGFEVSLLGPLKDAPPLPATVRFIPTVPHGELPGALASYDVLLLPYADTPYTQGTFPAKIYECLATGKPIVASPLPSLKPLAGLVYLASAPGDFVRAVRGLSAAETEERIAARLAAAREHAASAQFKKIESALRALYERCEN